MTSPRDTQYAQLSENEQKAYDRFEKVVLSDHVKHRDGQPGKVCILDQRNQFLNDGKRETMRCPDDLGWPNRGRTTNELGTAVLWAKSHYVPRLWLQRQMAAIHPTRSLSEKSVI